MANWGYGEQFVSKFSRKMLEDSLLVNTLLLTTWNCWKIDLQIWIYLKLHRIGFEVAGHCPMLERKSANYDHVSELLESSERWAVREHCSTPSMKWSIQIKESERETLKEPFYENRKDSIERLLDVIDARWLLMNSTPLAKTWMPSTRQIGICCGAAQSRFGVR